MSRRLRSLAVQQLLERAMGQRREELSSGLLKFIDAKPLPVGGCSKDKDALYGRAASCNAKGYKLFALIDAVSGAIDQWLLGPMNGSDALLAPAPKNGARPPHQRLGRPGPSAVLGPPAHRVAVWVAAKLFIHLDMHILHNEQKTIAA